MGNPLNTIELTERHRLSQQSIDSWALKARDYGKLRSVSITLGEQQHDALVALGDWPSISEHIRRAVDAYLDNVWIAEATGRVVASQDIDDMWISVTFHPYQGDPA